MKIKYPLFSQVALVKDLPEFNLRRGDLATIVEHYPMPDGVDDGYSLEGFECPGVTIELAGSLLVPIAQWQQEELVLAKLQLLSQSRRLQLEDYIDFLLQKDDIDRRSA
jgi:hypothetical protein